MPCGCLCRFGMAATKESIEMKNRFCLKKCFSIAGLLVACLLIVVTGSSDVGNQQAEADGRKNGSADTLGIEVGPYVQFTGPHSAVVRWDTTNLVESIVEYGASDDALISRSVNNTPTRFHEIELKDLFIKDKYFYRVGFSNHGQEEFSDVYWFDNNINYARIDVSEAECPYPVDAFSSLYEQAADQIVRETGTVKGICLVYGCGEGRLAFELAKRTDLMIIGVDTDKAKIDAAAEKLLDADVYGTRITVMYVDSLAHLPLSNYIANLIVSDRMIREGECPGSEEEMFRVLRPSGGIAYLGQPTGCPAILTQSELENWLAKASLKYTATTGNEGVWINVVRPDLPGAGWWSHAYGGPHNNGNANDFLEGATRTNDFDLQWIGWPGADAKVDRGVRGQGPVAQDGRMVFRGFNRIITLDTYNGTILWSLEIPGLNRFNIPRDSGWYCIDADSVYVAVHDDCWRLDANTGLRTVTHKLVDSGYEWGCVFRYGDKLYGSAVPEDSFYTGWWGDEYHYEGFNEKVCSKYIFANDLSGQRLWTYHSRDKDKGVIINSAICLGGGRIYFVESRNPGAEASVSGQIGEQLWKDLYLVSLNADTGIKLWEKDLKSGADGDPVVVDGTVTFFLMYSQETVIIALADSGTQYHLYTYDVSDSSCTSRWEQHFDMQQAGHGGNKKRPVIMGNRIFFEKRAYDLISGKLLTTSVPWANCGTYSGNAETLFLRSGTTAIWDANTGEISRWTRIRPSCWLNVIGSGGMVLAPEGGGGCDCYDGGFHTSVAYVRSDER